MVVVPIITQEWRVRGACRGRDLAQFFAPDGERQVAARQREAQAKAVCARCPVRPECAALALATRERHGVWGGFTSKERMRLLRLGWTDLVDRLRGRVDVAELERRLRTAPPERARAS